MSKIFANIEKSWNNRYYTIKIDINELSFDLYEKIGSDSIEYDIVKCYYDKKTNIACLSSNSIKDILNWYNKYKNIIVLNDINNILNDRI